MEVIWRNVHIYSWELIMNSHTCWASALDPVNAENMETSCVPPQSRFLPYTYFYFLYQSPNCTWLFVDKNVLFPLINIC